MSSRERFAETLLALVALTSLAVLALIAAFIFTEGMPLLSKVGFFEFVGGLKWAPGKNVFGILPMIIGSFEVTLGALLIGIPIGLASAIYLSEFSSPRTRSVLKPLIELLASIPSVVFGFLGLTIVVPLIRDHLGGPGFSVLAASIVLAVMILPTMVSISYDALQSVPGSYREGMLALGATRWQAVKMAVLPAARSGILAAGILAMGRAVGETMAVIMVAGNAVIIPGSPLDPVRTMTSNIALEMGYAAGAHRQALFATGIVLFLVVSALNILARLALKGK